MEILEKSMGTDAGSEWFSTHPHPKTRIAQIDRLLATGNYDSVIFSWDDTTKLGGRIFNTAQDLRDDIVERILATAAGH